MRGSTYASRRSRCVRRRCGGAGGLGLRVPGGAQRVRAAAGRGAGAARPAAAPLRVLHVSRPAPDARTAPQGRWVRGPGRPRARPRRQHRRQHRAPDAVPGRADAFAPLLELPGVFVMGSNDYFAPQLEEPGAVPLPAHAGAVTAPRLPTEDLVHGLLGAGWIDLTNRARRSTVAGPRARVRRGRRPALELRPLRPGRGAAHRDADLTRRASRTRPTSGSSTR